MSRSDTHTWHFQVRSLSCFQRHIPENKDSRPNGMRREREVSIRFSCSELGEPHGKGGGSIEGVREEEGHQESLTHQIS